MAPAKLFAATGDFNNDIQLPAMFDQEVNKGICSLMNKSLMVFPSCKRVHKKSG